MPKFDHNTDGYKSVMGLNKFVQPDENGVLRFKVRAYNETGTAFNIYEYINWYDGVLGCGQWVEGSDLGNTWYMVEFNANTCVLKIYDGKGLTDSNHTVTFTRKEAREIGIVIGGTSVDIAAVNPAERKPFGNNVGEVFLDSSVDTTVTTPEMYDKVMKRKSFNSETFTTLNISSYTEVRFMTLYQNNNGWYLFVKDWSDAFNCTDWLEWQFVKVGDTWTLKIYTAGKVYKTVEGLTGNTLQEVFKNKYPTMLSGGIGQETDFVWSTEVRAR